MKATYHLLEEPHKKALTLVVKQKNDDGTVDLHDEETGELRVGRCKVSSEPVHGQCVLDDGKAPKPDKPQTSGDGTTKPDTKPDAKPDAKPATGATGAAKKAAKKAAKQAAPAKK